MMRLKLVKQNTQFDFFKRWKMWIGFSSLMMVVSVVIAFAQGLNYGIDFRGGTTIRTQATTPVDIGQYRALIDPLGLGDVSIAQVFDPSFDDNQHVAQIRIQAQEGQESVSADLIETLRDTLGQVYGGQLWVLMPETLTQALTLTLLERFPQSEFDAKTLVFPAGTSLSVVDEIKQMGGGDTVRGVYQKFSFPAVESVGPKVSGELIQTAIWAVLAAIAMVIFYIWLRFEWQFSLGAVAALVHDVVITIGVFAILQIKFDLAIIAALLTIVGYSLNDTVVVYDRVRENLQRFKSKTLAQVLNISINETLSRTFVTSVTTLIALIALFVLGGDVIRGFVFAMIWGVIIGTYSSIFVATSLLLYLGVKRDWSKPSNTAGNQFSNIDA